MAEASASAAKTQSFPVLQCNQDVYSYLVHMNLRFLTHASALTRLGSGSLPQYIDLLGKKIDKAEQLEARNSVSKKIVGFPAW